MHELAPKVPRAGAVHKSIYLSVRVVAVVLVSLLTVAVSGKPVEAAGNPLNPVGLPNSWTAADVGAPAVRGSASDAACSNPTACPVFSISGAGLGIGGSSDQFMFLYQRLTGDGVVVMRLQTLAGTPTVEAGLMIRESLSAGRPSRCSPHGRRRSDISNPFDDRRHYGLDTCGQRQLAAPRADWPRNHGVSLGATGRSGASWPRKRSTCRRRRMSASW
jgi:hypothetical protein